MRNTFTVGNRLLLHRGFSGGTLGLSNLHFQSFWKFNSCGCGRIGWCVPKRWVKLASDRNCLKRLVRDTFREHKVKQQGIDILIKVCGSFTKNQKREWRLMLVQLLDSYALLAIADN